MQVFDDRLRGAMKVSHVTAEPQAIIAAVHEVVEWYFRYIAQCLWGIMPTGHYQPSLEIEQGCLK
jgi:hypothetical protein